MASQNFSSLKSCYRMGYRDFGRIDALKALDHYFLHHSRGCRQFDFSLETRPVTEAIRLKMEDKAA